MLGSTLVITLKMLICEGRVEDRNLSSTNGNGLITLSTRRTEMRRNSNIGVEDSAPSQNSSSDIDMSNRITP